jgi:hypothetical protein
MPNFSASAPALGYLFQIRFALDRILSASAEADMMLENLDDISFHTEGTPAELIQTKHHARVSNLTDSSEELWKTIRIWADHFSSGKIDPSNVLLTLVTNGSSATDTVAFWLSPVSSERNVNLAIERLNSVAATSSNTALETSITQYNRLNDGEKRRLVSAITVLTNTPGIIDVTANIKKQLIYAVREPSLDDLFSRLEGWWLSRAIKCLRDKSVVSAKEVRAQVHDFAEQYRQDSLPIDDFFEKPLSVDDVNPSERGFIDQLKLIKVGTTSLTKAISDYYRAFTHRSKWLRNGNLQVGEINRYETQLIDEWQRVFAAIKTELPADSQDEILEKTGRALFNRIESEFQIHIRPRADQPFIMRGSYHILASSGRVGWHPYFEEKLKHIFERAMEEAIAKDEQPFA